MTTSLVIVESPAKAKTIKKYLGKGFNVLASYGHVRDLVPKEGAVDPQNDFAMRYDAIEKNAKHVDAIQKALKKSDALYLATDPDREGEAISWHILELMKERNIIGDKPVHRVAFYEITKSAVNEAIANPREVSMDLVNAQQARRALDYLVGFNLSPLLWKKVRPGLSAGRVQSPALRLICERENEIEKFEKQEYWSIIADCKSDGQELNPRLTIYKDEKLTQFSVTNEKQADKIKKDLIKAAKGKIIVDKVEKKQRKRNPSPPFITSTLQQESARKLGYTTSRTMQLAQQLYEGIDIGEGAMGLITYMRTDSVNMANEAITQIREFIAERYGKENVPDEPRIYKAKAKNAQEAHEAIRPTDVNHTPEKIKSYLSDEQYKLYSLIWKRAVASQMIHATIDTVSIDFSCGKGNMLRANGSTIAEPGFITVYQEGVDDAKKDDDEDGKLLPPLNKGDEVKLDDIQCHQHFTEPPPRFTEASLVKALEEFGIGRPSTYASIIWTLKNREYVTIDKKRFTPTDVGRVVNRFLTEYFTQYVDYNFTANLEDTLDSISRGEHEWVPTLREFWDPFNKLVAQIDETVERKDVTQEKMDEACPLCTKPLSTRLGRRGRFVGCTGFPECNYTRSMTDNGDQPPEEKIERKCPDCQSDLVMKQGRYGKFIGCSGYPECKHIEPLIKPKETGVNCPECKQGQMLERRSRYGKIFYSCARYPDCKYAVWNMPLNQECPTCHWPVTCIKVTKRKGTERVCAQKECKFAEPHIAPNDTGDAGEANA